MWPSNALQLLLVASRWLLPWAIVLAMSAAIADAADALLVPALDGQTATKLASAERSQSFRMDDEFRLIMLPPVEAKGALTRVSCPADAHNVAVDVLVTSLQDLELLMSSPCVVRPQGLGS